MTKALIMTILGPDQRGLVRSIAGMIEKHEGNWVESRLARLAGQFAGVIRVVCPTGKIDGLKEDLTKLEEVGIAVNFVQEIPEVSPVSPSVFIEVIGNDRPGIIRELTDAIVTIGGNVEELTTGVESAPMSGGLIFRARGEVSFTESVALSMLLSSIEGLSDDLTVTITESK